LNELEGRVEVREAAAGAARSRRRLYLAEESTWARLDEPRHGDQGSIEVQVVALDDEPGPPPGLVKIDVEGAEVEVLQGMARLLAQTAPRLMIEMHGRNREVGELLRAAGYGLEVVEEDVPLEDASWWVHVLAVPASP
jgi:hypothetical protein